MVLMQKDRQLFSDHICDLPLFHFQELQQFVTGRKEAFTNHYMMAASNSRPVSPSRTPGSGGYYGAQHHQHHQVSTPMGITLDSLGGHE